MKKTLCTLLLSTALVATTSWAVDMTPPDVLAKNTANQVLAAIKKDKAIRAGNQQKIHALIEAKVVPHFDIQRMTQLAVGRYWSRATPSQRRALTSDFETLMVRTYSASLAAYRNQTITFKPLRLSPSDTDVVVKSEISQPGGQDIPVDYRLEKTSEGWKVYDIVVDDVSLVTNYRSSFGNEIERAGIDGLIQTLDAKNREGAR